MLYILIVVISAVAQFFLPWWVIAPVCFLLAYFRANSAKQAFATGTAAITTVWVAYAWFQHYSTNGILTLQMANVLPLGGNAAALVAITGLVGGLVGGLSALAGYHGKTVFGS